MPHWQGPIVDTDYVLVRDPIYKGALAPRYTGPYKILKLQLPTLIIHKDGKEQRVNIDRCRKFYSIPDLYPESTLETNQTLPLDKDVPNNISPRLNQTIQNKLSDSKSVTRRVFHPNGKVENHEVSNNDVLTNRTRSFSQWNTRTKPQAVSTPISKRVAQYMNPRRQQSELPNEYTYLQQTDSKMDTALTHLINPDNVINFRPIQDESIRDWQTRKKTILDFSDRDLYKYSDVQEMMDTPISHRTRSRLSNITPDHHLVGD